MTTDTTKSLYEMRLLAYRYWQEKRMIRDNAQCGPERLFAWAEANRTLRTLVVIVAAINQGHVAGRKYL